MSRSVGWVRTVSDAVSWRQDQALSSTIFILRQTGPTGFLIKEEGQTSKFKVFLGDPHRCTCSVFMKEKDLCKHICWVLLRKYRISRQNPVSWQLGLVEREINEILRGDLARQETQPSQAARKYAGIAGQLDPAGRQSFMQQREIGADDICPICQDELLAKHLPVTYCKFGCGNNVHIKCMKVWADHQKSSGKTVIECPFCRENFGPIELLQKELQNSSQRETRAERLNEQLGTTCRICHACPIIGKCYKCATCENYHLCQACFNTSTHLEHSFLFRQKVNQRWRPVPKRGTSGALPEAVVNNLMSREISDSDYDLLLQLDSTPDLLSDLTEETVRTFPVEHVRANHALLAPGHQCRICLRGYQEHDTVRRLPCHHKYHKDCIDAWLLHRHPTCPIDGTVFTNEGVRQMKEATRNRLLQLRENRQSQLVKQNNRSMLRDVNNHCVGQAALQLEIPGIGIARITNSSCPLRNETTRNSPASLHSINSDDNSMIVNSHVIHNVHDYNSHPHSQELQRVRRARPPLPLSATQTQHEAHHGRNFPLSDISVGQIIGYNIQPPNDKQYPGDLGLQDMLNNILTGVNGREISPDLDVQSITSAGSIQRRSDFGSSTSQMSEMEDDSAGAMHWDASSNGALMFDPNSGGSHQREQIHFDAGHSVTENRVHVNSNLHRKPGRLLKPLHRIRRGSENPDSSDNVFGEQHLVNREGADKPITGTDSVMRQIPSLPHPRSDSHLVLSVGSSAGSRSDISQPSRSTRRKTLDRRPPARHKPSLTRTSEQRSQQPKQALETLYIGHNPSSIAGIISDAILASQVVSRENSAGAKQQQPNNAINTENINTEDISLHGCAIKPNGDLLRN